MNLKVPGSVFVAGCNFSSFLRHNPTNLLRTSHLLSQKVQFSSTNDDSNSESKLKNLLNKSSPLRPSLDDENIWATSPYISGTVFKEFDEEQTPVDPSKLSVIMFPGQGNQFVGMAKNLLKYPAARDMFDAASEILKYDLLKLCEEGPESKLQLTEYCQPATLVCSLAALEKLKDERPWAIDNCVATCGYSLGEYSALVFAGVLKFDQAVRLVQLRAEAMSVSCRVVEGGMMTVLYGPRSELNNAINDAIQHCKENKKIIKPVCSVASYLFPGCKVIGGHIEALNFIIENCGKYGLRRLSKLPVSGAFHTEIMEDASVMFCEYLEKFEFQDPLIKVYSNLSGKLYYNRFDIKKKLPLQISRPVKWQQVMHSVFERPKGMAFPYAYECGPGDSLTTLLKKINISASLQCYAVKV